MSSLTILITVLVEMYSSPHRTWLGMTRGAIYVEAQLAAQSSETAEDSGKVLHEVMCTSLPAVKHGVMRNPPSAGHWETLSHSHTLKFPGMRPYKLNHYKTYNERFVII